MTSDVLFEMKGAVLVVTFNRPEKGNALTVTMVKALGEKLKAVSAAKSARVILLRGQGEHFMNGHDLAGFIGDAHLVQEQIFNRIHFFYTAIREMHGMDMPVIAAIDGKVTGAGFSFMLACDLVLASKRAILNADFLSYAMVPDGGASFFLPRKVGAARASEILFLGQDFSADQAEKWGLINRVVPDEDLHAEALAWAERLAEGPTRAYGAAKRLISRAFDQEINVQLSMEAASWTGITKTFDFRESLKSIATKQPPKYTGA